MYFYCICLRSITLCNSLAICFLLSSRLLRNIGEFGAKIYFTDYRTANAIQLVVVIKGNFSVFFFFFVNIIKIIYHIMKEYNKK